MAPVAASTSRADGGGVRSGLHGRVLAADGPAYRAGHAGALLSEQARRLDIRRGGRDLRISALGGWLSWEGRAQRNVVRAGYLRDHRDPAATAPINICQDLSRSVKVSQGLSTSIVKICQDLSRSLNSITRRRVHERKHVCSSNLLPLLLLLRLPLHLFANAGYGQRP